MLLWYSYGRTFARLALCFCTITIFSFAENGSSGASPAPTPKHFDHVLIVVLENQSYDSAIRNDVLKSLFKPQEVAAAYNHYSVLRTIEDNFGLEPIHKESGDGTASVITGIWK